MRLLSTWRRAVSAATLAAAALVGPVLATSTPVQASPMPAQPGRDFATATWGDPWDFANAADVLLDNGYTSAGLVSPHFSSSGLSFTTGKGAYFSPLWTGIPHALQLDRDGSLPQNTVDTTSYTHLSFSATASGPVSAGIFWFHCAAQSGTCWGGLATHLNPGTNTYDVDLANAHLLTGTSWGSAPVHGLRFALSTPGVAVTFHWMSLYAPGTDTSVAPVIDQPNAQGGADFSTSVLHKPWNMNSTASIAHLNNVCRVSFTAPRGALTGVNCGPVINDPGIWLNVGKGFDGRVWHRLTVTFSYDYPFNLHDTCKGGTHGRVLWRESERGTMIMQTKPLVTYHDRTKFTVDLAAPRAALNEESRPKTAYPFADAHGHVTALRFDPNEGRCGQDFHVYDVKLTRDAAPNTAGIFTTSWHGASGPVTLYYDTDRDPSSGLTPIPGAAGLPGSGSFNWDMNALPHGHYFIYAVVGGAGRYSGGPVTK